jgi:small subunit ribosomal protein S20
MANHFSALERARQIKRRTEVNRARKSKLRHQIRAFRRTLASGKLAEAERLLPATFSVIDRAAKWGIIKDNTAARYKSRLHARLKNAASS